MRFEANQGQADARVKITDSAGTERFAQLYFVSPDRITLLISPQTLPGVALFTVTNGNNAVAQGMASVGVTAPGLFSADLSGQGYAAALVLRIRADGSQRNAMTNDKYKIKNGKWFS